MTNDFPPLPADYDPKVGAKKALGAAGTVIASLVPVLVDPLIQYLSTDANVSQALGAVDPKLLAFAPLIAAGIRLLANYRKQSKGK